MSAPFVPPHLRGRDGSHPSSSSSSGAPPSNRYALPSMRPGMRYGMPERVMMDERNFPTLGNALGPPPAASPRSAFPKPAQHQRQHQQQQQQPAVAPPAAVGKPTLAEAAARAQDAEIAAEQEAMEQAAALAQETQRPTPLAASDIVKKEYKQQMKFDQKLVDIKPLKQVSLSGSVITKIIQHCKQQQDNGAAASRSQQDQSTTPLGSTFTPVSGQLLGIDSGSTLDITDSFPFYITPPPPPSYQPYNQNNNTPKNGAITAAANAVNSIVNEFDGPSTTESEYLRDMLNCLSEINYDVYPIGWYMSTNMGTFWSHALLDTQFRYQKMFPQAVVLIHDTTLTHMGNLSIRAFRLSNDFMAMYENSRHITSDAIAAAQLDISSILEVVPTTIHNSTLHSALLQGLEQQSSEFPHEEEAKMSSAAAAGKILEGISALSINSEILDLGFDKVLEKQLENVTDALEILDRIQWRYGAWMKRTGRDRQRLQQLLQRMQQENSDAEGRPQLPHSANAISQVKQQLAHLSSNEPNRLESLIIVNQVATYCNQITQTAGPALTKMYIAKGAN